MVELDAIPVIAKTELQVPDRIVGEIVDEVGDPNNIKEITKRYIALSRDDLELADINAKSTCLYAWNRVIQRSTRAADDKNGRAAEVAKQTSKMVDAIKAVCVMDIILPTGKRLRDSTFAECRTAGGFFMHISAKGKPDQIVGKVLSDQEAQSLWKK